MKSFFTFISEDKDYKGEHKAAGADSAPLHDLTMNGVYPEDVYSSKGLQYYGTGSELDSYAYNIIRNARNRKNARVKIYRAVPYNTSENIKDIQKAKAMWLKSEKVLPGLEKEHQQRGKQFYDWLCDQEDSLNKGETSKLEINHGDWVTIVHQYAKDHGEAHLNKKYKVISRTDPARDLFTSGDSWLEWGWNPTAAKQK